ncbi:hypothetical protein T440DRAFT_552805 [Plenodomus tracheiphilus IPT5]|uniref:Uncharacterized protein n=1 Tax=Plenodomus tracheiphilus IPT5 TaxID=1408161 RepID=A0A6A7BGS7_9PLEO|nr:hypothetical protein T440DRAFT_552805 [Plenodomus tracheiphilus IPT5]
MFRSPLFAWSPRPDQDLQATPASQSSSRFGAFRLPRTIFNGSSIYSQSPALEQAATPKIPFLGFWQRQSPDPNTLPTSHEAPRESHDSRSPLRAQHSAGSYIGTIAPRQDPQEPQVVYSRHPADVPLPHQQDDYADPEVQQLAEEINGRRHRRRHRRRRHTNRTKQFVRRRGDGSTSVVSVKTRGTAARGKMFACIISGSFLVTVLAIYLAIALTNRNLGQEIHILFIMILLAITIFFCHSLIRLCMLILNPPGDANHPNIPSMTGPDGFKPIIPIRVHLARDEESGITDEPLDSDTEIHDDPEKDTITPPPPAYGLWRSSVRADPNLLHWQRAEDTRGSVVSSMPQTRHTSVVGAPVVPTNTHTAPEAGPRPPSYVSEDGVSYIVEAAAPRSTVNRESHSGVSDIHPAWRPGYAMSEIQGDEWGRRV